MIKRIKDPVSSLTHLAGALISIPCTILLLQKAYIYATPLHMFSFAVFGTALFLLYAASAVYHMLPVSEKISNILRRIDHMMIFVLIAGTYTPVCLIPLRGIWGWTLLILVWLFAIAGITIKAFWIDAPRMLSTSIYLLMGWFVILAFYPLVRSVPVGGILLLVSGGIVYSLGAVIYAAKWPHINFRLFGFHELFHLFVLGGSVFHFLFMFIYILAI